MPTKPKSNRRTWNARASWQPQLYTLQLEEIGTTYVVISGIDAGLDALQGEIDMNFVEIRANGTPLSCAASWDAGHVTFRLTFAAQAGGVSMALRIAAWMPSVRDRFGGYFAPTVLGWTA